jgi:hypothetical protein
LKFSPEPIPRPPETTIRAAVNSGRSDLVSSWPTKRVYAQRHRRRHPFDRCGAALAGNRCRKGGAAHRHHFDWGAALYRGQQATGVDRADEGVGILHADDVGQLGDAEQCGYPRHQILAEGGGWRQYVTVILVGESGDQYCEIFGKVDERSDRRPPAVLWLSPGSLALAVAASAQLFPATSMWISPPMLCAAVTVFKVAASSVV